MRGSRDHCIGESTHHEMPTADETPALHDATDVRPVRRRRSWATSWSQGLLPNWQMRRSEPNSHDFRRYFCKGEL